jgi:hypothetical protein
LGEHETKEDEKGAGIEEKARRRGRGAGRKRRGGVMYSKII